MAESYTEEVGRITMRSVAKLMALVEPATVRAFIDAIRMAEGRGELTWEPYRGSRDTFGSSLAQQLRDGRKLTPHQINCAKARLLPRNWQQIRTLLREEYIAFPLELLRKARTDPNVTPPTYETRYAKRKREAAERAVALSVATRIYAARRMANLPPVPPVTQTCLQPVPLSTGGCLLQLNHRGPCRASSSAGALPPPTPSLDEQIRQVVAVATEQAITPFDSRAPATEEMDPSVERFKRLDLDDSPASPEQEPEFDASVERFRLLDLD